MTSCWRFCSRFFDKPMKTLAAMVAVVLLTGLYFQQKNFIKFKESETSFRPTTTISTQQTTEKTTQNKICEISFDYGEMCPDLYTGLGGFCNKKDKLYCPDIRRKIKTNLRASQLVLTRMLKIFDIIAREHNITYWITSGTLLGAARHHGFIPWDEDADIQMPLKEYIKLFKCCKKEFPSGIFFQNSKTDPHLKPSNGQSNVTRHPLIGLYKTPWNPRLRDTLSCTRYCLENNCKWEDGLMIDMFIAEDTLTSEQRAGVFPLQKMTFEGFVFPVPNNWEEILHDFYGDYENEFGEEDSRVPQDNSDPFHSCRVLKRRIMKKRLMKEREHRKAKRRTIRGLA